MSINLALTGADERTPIADLIRFADAGVEIGFLYTYSPDGRHRYPNLRWIIDAADALGGRCAIHVCGARAKTSFTHGMDYLRGRAKRFQINGDVSRDDLIWACEFYPGQKIITQHTPKNSILVFADFLENHEILVDASGGRGISPAEWKRPKTPKRVGFAGGLGPNNIAAELPKIATVAGDDWWIDMGGKLRDSDDWFSVEKAAKVIAEFQRWKAMTA